MTPRGPGRTPGRRHRWFRLSPRPLARARGSERGFTIIELVVAVSVFAIVAGGLAAMAGSGLNLSRNNRERSIAANLASADQDAAVSLDFTDLVAEVGSPTVTNPTVGNASYTVTRDVGWEYRDGKTSICNDDPEASTLWVLRVTSTASWSNRPEPIKPASATTIVSPPVGYTRDSSQGTVPVTLSDPSADPPAPVANVEVLVNGTFAGLTNGDGCAFLLLDTGNYTVSLVLAGYVDRQGNEFPSTTLFLSRGGSVPISFDYAPAASLTATPLVPSAADVPAGVPLTLGNQFFPTGTQTIVTSFPATIGSLFPATYDVWTGDCDDADPTSTYWPVGDSSSIAAPGSGTVAMGGVAVTGATSGATVVATHNPAFGACPNGSTSKAGLTLGVTDGSGQLTSALPFGHWKVSVGAGASVPVEVSPTGSGLVAVVVTS